MSRTVRLLAFLLTTFEPLEFAVVAAGSWSAIRVRGAAVVLVLAARLITTLLCVVAGRMLLTGAATAFTVARVALAASAAVRIFAYTTPYFPSNRMPGDTPLYVAATLIYYVGWMLYLTRRRADL
jgi:hypothetical protein